MNTEERNVESTNILTAVDSKCSLSNMVRFADIEKGMRQQIATDLKYLKSNYAQQNKLRPAVQQFRDLQSEAKAREERIQRIAPLMGEGFKDLRKVMLAGYDASNEIPITIDDDIALWMAIRAIVEQVEEIQVVELQHALEHFNRSTSRQAIESALASHRDIFETKVRNRDKFVSLKR